MITGAVTVRRDVDTPFTSPFTLDKSAVCSLSVGFFPSDAKTGMQNNKANYNGLNVNHLINTNIVNMLKDVVS